MKDSHYNEVDSISYFIDFVIFFAEGYFVLMQNYR